MKFKYLLKQISPPIFVTIYRRLFENKSYVFEGVYKNLTSVPIQKETYKDESYVKEISLPLSKIEDVSQVNFYFTIDLRGLFHYQFLPFLIATIKKENKKINILDFGGGAAIGYISCKHFSSKDNLKFHIIHLYR